MIAALSVVVVLVGFVALDALVLWRRVERIDVQLTGSGPGTTYLFVGSDSRGFVDNRDERITFGDEEAVPGERADLLLVVHVARSGAPTRVMSIPRDLLVVTPERARTRVALTFRRGAQSLVDALCGSLGIGVDRLVVIRFDGFRALVDAVGGIDVTIAAPMRDTVSGLLLLEPGRVHLDGDVALAYVRARHVETLGPTGWRADPAASADRGERARAVLEGVGAGTQLSIFHPLAAQRIAWTATGAVAVDSGAGPFALPAIERVAHDLASATEVTLPVRTEGGNVPLAFLERGAADALARLRGSPPPTCPRPALPRARPRA